MQNTKWLRTYAVLMTVFALLVSSAFVFLLHHTGYDTKILVKLGIQQPVKKTNWAVVGWNNTLEKLDYDADIAFLGDSIIRGSDFREYFPNIKIVNSGYPGDSLTGMTDRIAGIAALSPEKIFVMGGINGLSDSEVEQSIADYTILLDALHTAIPTAKVYVQSTLPISAEKEATVCLNTTIQEFNRQLAILTQQKGDFFIDLYSLYEKDGVINPAFTKDGIHLQPEAYAIWASAISEYIY